MSWDDLIGRTPADLLSLDTQVKEIDRAFTCELCKAPNESKCIRLARWSA